MILYSSSYCRLPSSVYPSSLPPRPLPRSLRSSSKSPAGLTGQGGTRTQTRATVMEHQNGVAQTTGCGLTVLDTKRPKSRCQQARLSDGPRGKPSLSLLASCVSQQSLVFLGFRCSSHRAVFSLCVVTAASLCTCLCVVSL